MSIGRSMKTYPVSIAMSIALPYNSETSLTCDNDPEYNTLFIATVDKTIRRMIGVYGYITLGDILAQFGYTYNIYVSNQIVTSLHNILYDAVKQEITILCSFDIKPEDIQKEERK